MIALGNGAQNAVKARIARLGTNVLQINAQRVQQGGVGSANTAKLTMKDVNMIFERAPHVAAVNMQQDRNLQVVWKTKNANVQITGTVPNFLAVRGFAMQYGRMISDEDNNARRRVAVLGADVLKALNVTDGASLLDAHIRIGGKEAIRFPGCVKREHADVLDDACWRGVGVTVGGRHLHYEHHVGFCYRTHTRDWRA